MPSRVTLRRKSRAAAPEDAVETQQEESVVAPEVDMADETKEEQVAAEESVASSSSAAKTKFVLVMDNGQLALVPEGKAQNYRSLPKRGQHLEQDESGTSTPLLKKKNKSTSNLRSMERSSPRIVVRPLKRGRGRPPKHRSRSRMLEFELEEDDEDEGGEDGEEEEEMEEEAAETPTEEAELQGGEETNIGEDSEILPAAIEQSVFVRGKDYLLRNDELVLDRDEEGEKKVDEKGNLLEGREYKFKTFSSPYRADKEVQYAFGGDVAKGAGYRDSLYFFRQNPLLIKLSCTEKEKALLVEQGILGANLLTRNVTIVAVRNVYKIQGAKVIKDGRFILDDYYEAEARESGKMETDAVIEEETVAPQPRAVERKRDADRDRGRRRPDAFTFSTSDLQGNAIYTTFGDAGLSPFERARGWNARRVNLQKADIDETNWMMEMARSVRGMNHEILVSRNERLKAFPRPYEGIDPEVEEEEEEEKKAKEEDAEVEDKEEGEEKQEQKKKKAKPSKLPVGFFEPLTNMPHYSSLTQPSWATLSRVRERPLLGKQTDDGSDGAPILGNAKVGSHGWGLASFDQIVSLPLPKAREVVVPAGASAEEV
jgi:chromatin structure-remodeling complex protein RSC7